MKKDVQQVRSAVEQAKEAVRVIYKDDPRMKDEKNARADSGLARETDIVFKEVLRFYLNS